MTAPVLISDLRRFVEACLRLFNAQPEAPAL